MASDSAAAALFVVLACSWPAPRRAARPGHVPPDRVAEDMAERPPLCCGTFARRRCRTSGDQLPAMFWRGASAAPVMSICPTPRAKALRRGVQPITWSWRWRQLLVNDLPGVLAKIRCVLKPERPPLAADYRRRQRRPNCARRSLLCRAKCEGGMSCGGAVRRSARHRPAAATSEASCALLVTYVDGIAWCATSMLPHHPPRTGATSALVPPPAIYARSAMLLCMVGDPRRCFADRHRWFPVRRSASDWLSGWARHQSQTSCSSRARRKPARPTR